MVPFVYEQVTPALLQALEDLLAGGESLVFLGPRGAGKRYTLRHLAARLREQGYPIVGMLDCRLANAAAAFPSNASGIAPLELETLPDWVEQQRMFGRAITLFVTDVDDLPWQKAKNLLRQIRTWAERGDFRVVLTGEVDLRQLVFGPTSEFNCANQYVLTGLGVEAFREVVARSLESLQPALAELPEDLLRRVHFRTGGNVTFLRLLLWAAVEKSIAGSGDRPFAELVDGLSDREVAALAPWRQHDRYLARLIANTAATWGRLGALLRDDRLPVVENAPEVLELVGVAIREGNELRPASPLALEFIRSHFTARRFADLFASQGKWAEAFGLYRQLPPAERCRPATVDDVAEATAVVKDLSTSLYEQAAAGAMAVRRRFTDGCRELLGLSEVTFWQRQADHWVCVHDQDAGPPRAALGCYTALLPRAPSGPPRGEVIEVWGQAELCCVAALVLALRSDVQEAVIVGDPTETTFLSEARRHLTADLLSHFVAAYGHAVHREHDRQRLRTRERHAAIVNGIFEGLGTKAKDVGGTLELAAEGMRGLGYRRVVFSLVDPTGERIRGVFEDSDDPNRTVMGLTDFPVEGSIEDGQQAVVRSKDSWVITDASTDPLANPAVVAQAGLKCAAVVPLKNFAEVVVGTLHVERQDGTVPTQMEVMDLEQFGKQLAIAIEQSERVNMLESALDTMREPVGILDRRLRVRYVNKHAAACVGIKVGWQPADEAKPFEDCEQPVSNVVARFLPELERSLEDRERRVHHMPVIKKGKTCNVALLTQHILNWKGDVVGVFLHAQELSYLYRVFEALRRVQNANGTQAVIDYTVEATRILGHRWGRLYQLNSADEPALVSKASYGDPNLDEKFDNGEITLAPRSKANTWETWLCIENEEPVVFCHFEAKPDRTRVATQRGLEATNVQEPKCPPKVAKKEGDFWIDFPLLGGDRPLGKLTLHCTPQYNPEDWEFLRVLCDLTSRLLVASLARERENESRDAMLRRNADAVVSDVCHHIGTSLATLPALVSSYRQLGRNDDRLEQLNATLEATCRRVNRQMKDTRARLTQFVTEKKPADLVAILHSAFAGVNSNLDWQLTGETSSLTVDVDAPQFESALLELIHNARQCSPEPNRLEFALTLRVVPHPKGEAVVLLFCDNGPGVPPEYKERIFDRFFSRRPRGESGTGQGLDFVRRVIEAHGGTIREDGTPGEGARFVVELPRSLRADRPANPTP